MSVPKVLACLIFCLFAAIAFAGWWKNGHQLFEEPAASVAVVGSEAPLALAGGRDVETAPLARQPLPPEVDRIEELFRTSGPKLPIVETITYKSHVSWLKGRQAWLSDYASHYHTSRHFIARSYNGKADYLKQEMPEGARFNIFRPDIRLQFHLVIDLSRCKLWLYYQNLDSGERELIKSYTVGLGRFETESPSGLLTPLGAYSLGDKVATYMPTTTGMYQGKKTQLIRIFGTRWIPFDTAIGATTAPPRGYGLHGVPWVVGPDGQLVEDTSSLGQYASDGCIRLATKDIEELFAILITQPTVVELVEDFYDATFPLSSG